jgi:hypothetical protein
MGSTPIPGTIAAGDLAHHQAHSLASSFLKKNYLESELVRAVGNKIKRKLIPPSITSPPISPRYLTVSFITSIAAVIIWKLLPKEGPKTKRKLSKKMAVKSRTKVSSKGQTKR